MVATPARISFITSPFRRAISEDEAVRTRHGSLARESDDPIETYFDDVDDAQTVADERLGLLSAERRLFTMRAVGVSEAIALDFIGGAVPVLQGEDPERKLDRKMVLASMTINLADQQVDYSVWG